MSDGRYSQPELYVKSQEVIVDMLVAAVVKTFVTVLGLVLALTAMTKL
jgi:hypothetical protein